MASPNMYFFFLFKWNLFKVYIVKSIKTIYFKEITMDTISSEKYSSFQLDEQTMSVGELWKEIEKISSGRVIDNANASEVSLTMRQDQVVSLEVLLQKLRESHTALQEELMKQN